MKRRFQEFLLTLEIPPMLPQKRLGASAMDADGVDPRQTLLTAESLE